MRKLLSLVAVLAVCNTYAQYGKVYDDLSVESKILKSQRKFAIYLPPDYESSQRSYPVLYLLHGATDNHTGWVQFGEVRRIADEAINSGKATPMIIVMPDADTERMGYFNSIDEKWRYEDFFFEELMPYVEKTYRIKGEKRYRAIAGLSMGGGGTFMYAMRHPELFSSACPLSAYVGALDLESMKRWMPEEEKKLGDEKLEAYRQKNNALELMKQRTKEELNSVRWFIDCGDDDFLFEGNSLMHIALTKAQVKHEYRVRDGAHNWTYWRDSLPVVLRFVSDAFHQY
ncbi:MAG: 1,4-beta-xylanase [Flammeovirgaceae bacterium]|nr:1,4-beta-xylanase [Flammeovirgaceae bacterium]MBR07180.1 1,4-beta-xylanase [Rickettsiales bacterium]HCX22795.1 1,4-beta-xylanase [Cytophagales bacterium]